MKHTATLDGKKIYIHHVSEDKKYVLVSYSEEPRQLFKADTESLQDVDATLIKKLEREH